MFLTYSKKQERRYRREVDNFIKLNLSLIENINFSIIYHVKDEIKIFNNVKDVKFFFLECEYIIETYKRLISMILSDDKINGFFYNKKLLDIELKNNKRPTIMYLHRYKEIINSKLYKNYIRKLKLNRINE